MRACPRGGRRGALGVAMVRAGFGLLTALGALAATAMSARAQTPPANPCTGLGVQPVSLAATMPINFSALAQSQAGANCLAWQAFIYLNWQADAANPGRPDPKAPPSRFGAPGVAAPTVWESYPTAAAVFASTAKPLRANAAQRWKAIRPARKNLGRISKLGDASLDLGTVQQADHGWLTAQSGTLTYYEVLMNLDEYDFITGNVFAGNNLATYAGQLACASQPGINGRGGFNLPAGNNAGNQDTDCAGNNKTYGLNFGAIELKAAWVILPADGSLNARYKIAKATITDPFGHTSDATVGLVGLHIIHKLPGANQMIWATFEHIDNTPDDNGGQPVPPQLPPNNNQRPRAGFTFFNAGCTASSDPVYQCQPNQRPGQPCAAGQNPPGCFPYAAPMQTTRLVPVQGEANAVTAYAWSLMPVNSVFNYYRLIDVQWPSQPTPVPPGTTVANMPRGDITPDGATRVVANTTMETFVQQSLSCMDCHRFASIASAANQLITGREGRAKRSIRLSLPRAGAPSPFASGYSFMFSTETTH